MNTIREQILEVYGEVAFLEPEIYDSAIIGVSESCNRQPVIAYDRDVILEILVSDGMSFDEALEFYEYNMLGTYIGVSTPTFIDQSFVTI